MADKSELRDLVLKTLDTNGILSNLKAQVRSSVYQVLESQDGNLKKNSGFALQNPVCQKLNETTEGQNIFDLINEFLLFLKMDYTQSVYVKEANLKTNLTRDKLIKKIGLKENIDTNKPVLMHIVNQYLRGMIGGAPFDNISKTTVINDTIDVKSGLKLSQPTKNNKADSFKNQTNYDEEDDDIKPTITKKIEAPKKVNNLPQKKDDNKKNITGLPKAQDKKNAYAFDLPEDNLFQKKTNNNVPPDTKLNKYAGNLKDFGKNNNINDEELIEEEVFVDEDIMEEDLQKPNKKGNTVGFTSSEEMYGASQSQGIDESVSSAALEGYDYYEEIDINKKSSLKNKFGKIRK